MIALKLTVDVERVVACGGSQAREGEDGEELGEHVCCS